MVGSTDAGILTDLISCVFCCSGPSGNDSDSCCSVNTPLNPPSSYGSTRSTRLGIVENEQSGRCHEVIFDCNDTVIVEKALEKYRKSNITKLKETQKYCIYMTDVSIDSKMDVPVILKKKNLHCQDEFNFIANEWYWLKQLHGKSHLVNCYGADQVQCVGKDEEFVLVQKKYCTDIHYYLVELHHNTSVSSSLSLSSSLSFNKKRREFTNNLVSNDSDEYIVLEMASGIIKGLQNIHSINAVHNDVTPANIFVDFADGHYILCVADFGSMLESGAWVKGISTISTFMPPEVHQAKLRGERFPVKGSIDRWQLGILLGMIACKDFFHHFYKQGEQEGLQPQSYSSETMLAFSKGLRDKLEYGAFLGMKQDRLDQLPLKKVIQDYEDIALVDGNEALAIMAWYLFNECPCDRPAEDELLEFIADFQRIKDLQ